jgi:hypothetical protein
LACACLLAIGAPTAQAADPASALAGAEESASVAQGEISSAEAGLSPTKAAFEVARHRAAPADAAAASARARLAHLRNSAHSTQAAARARIERREATHREEVEDHDESLAAAIGFGLALLLLALIALGWDFFRASALVAWLVGRDRSQAIGFCIGGGLLAVVIGAVLGGPSVLGAIGWLIVGLGLALPAALLLARHSAEVQARRARPILRRERLPRSVPLTACALSAVLALAALAGSAFAEGPAPASVSAQLRAEAGPPTVAAQTEISRAASRATQLSGQAKALDRKRAAAHTELAAAEGELEHAEGRLASAESSADRYSNQLVALEERKARELAREEAKALREAETAEAQATEEAAEECDPNYSGCLDPNASDYDCAGGSGDGPLYTGTVEVIGYDHYGLDEDGDGIGCEP